MWSGHSCPQLLTLLVWSGRPSAHLTFVPKGHLKIARRFQRREPTKEQIRVPQERLKHQRNREGHLKLVQPQALGPTGRAIPFTYQLVRCYDDVEFPMT